jgi:hypothetical protein
MYIYIIYVLHFYGEDGTPGKQTEVAVFRLYLYAAILICIDTKKELTENGKFCLFAATGKRKQRTSVCLLQTEMETRSLSSLVGKP